MRSIFTRRSVPYYTVTRDETTQIPLRSRLFALTVVLLLIAASRIVRLDSHQLHPDEVWSVWQTFGTVGQIVQWTPYDWTPLFYLIIGGWRILMGIHPVSLMMLTVFVFMITTAILYRLVRHLYSHQAGWIAMLVFGALGYDIYLSLFVRSHIFVLMLSVLSLWLAFRYFEHPTRIRAVWLSLSLASMLYMHISAIFGIVTIGLFMLILYPRRVRYWILPTIITAVLIVPVLLQKLAIATSRASVTAPYYENKDFLATLIQLLLDIWHDFAGYHLSLWAAFLVIAAVLIVQRWKMQGRAVGLLFWMLSPALFLFVAPLVDAFHTRHLPWITIGVAMWIGWGFSYLPRAANLGVSLVLVAVMFGPVPIDERYLIRPPVTTTFNDLAHNARWGDVVVVDPNSTEVGPDEWDYYVQVYFPRGLTFVTNPAGYRRVWYVFDAAKQDATLKQSVQAKRVPETLLGKQTFTLQLYEAPPDVEGVLFENGMRFHGAELIEQAGPTLARRTGEAFHVRLWWSIDRAQQADYSVGTYVTGPKGTIAQFDGPPQVNGDPRETSRWVMGRYYIEEREIEMPYPTYERHLSLYMGVYQWQTPQQRLAAPGVNKDNLLFLQPIEIKHWLTPP